VSPVVQHINRSPRYPQYTQPTPKPGPRRPRTFRYLVVPVILLGAIGLGIWHTNRAHTAALADAIARDGHPDSGLASIVTTWAGQHTFATAVAVTELTGDLRTAERNAGTSVIPASTYKIYVAYAVLDGVERGSYKLSTHLSDGHTVQTDLNNMILDSDNDSARTLGFLVGWKNIDSLLRAQGLTATTLNNYAPPSTQPVGDKHTTANDLSTFLGKLYSGQLLGKTNTTLLLGLMQNQHYRQRIPAGIPGVITVADKPGWLTPADGAQGYIQNDAAIVYGPKSTYILVITTTGSSTKPLADLSKLVYNYLQT